MGNALLPYLEKLLADIEKDAKRFRQKSQDALFIKPMAEWTPAEHSRWERTTTDKMLAESDKWMQRQIDAEFAVNELRNLIFLQGLKRGR